MELSKLGEGLVKDFGKGNVPWLLELLSQLQKEGLVSISNGTKDISLPRSS